MGTEQVLKDLEKTIKRVSIDIKKKKGAVGVDKLNSLTKMVNAYGRLFERHKEFAKEEKVRSKRGKGGIMVP